MVILEFFQAGFEVVLSSAPAIKLHISSTTSCRTTHAILGGGFNPSKSICQIDKSFIISSISACRRVNRNNHDKKAPPRMPAAISEKNTSNNSPFQRKAVRKKKTTNLEQSFPGPSDLVFEASQVTSLGVSPSNPSER